MNPMMRPTQSHATPGARIVYLFLFLLVGLFIAGLFLVVISQISLGGQRPSTIYVSTIFQSVFAFLLPAYLAIRIEGGIRDMLEARGR